MLTLDSGLGLASSAVSPTFITWWNVVISVVFYLNAVKFKALYGDLRRTLLLSLLLLMYYVILQYRSLNTSVWLRCPVMLLVSLLWPYGTNYIEFCMSHIAFLFWNYKRVHS